ncbi:MAG TPA: N-acetyltransferase [Spirochaetota bacterium]|nr:N-acetyltransferase [Spirochaetota bacterium]HOM39023.1 N-acetyltransferase [Spirochaetota bacterium]HPQ49924.1 N-acetyltransferase [Spirochaetota bacterium]
MKVNIVDFYPSDKKMTKKLYNFIIEHYKDDPYFVPTLKIDLLGSKLLGIKGLLRNDHPFFEHAEAKYFMAFDENSRPVGSIAAVINHAHNQYHNENIGFFGFFECIEDYKVAKKLLDSAKEFLKSKGIKIVRGPANFSTNEPVGLMISGFDNIPYMYTAYNKKYYQDFIEKYGGIKVMDLIAMLMPVVIEDEEKEKERKERMAKLVNKIKDRYNIRIENFKKSSKKHLEDIELIYREAWKDNWGFVPPTKKEFKILADSLKIAADPLLVKIAYINNEPAAFIGALPDINEVVHRKKKSNEFIKLFSLIWYLFRKKFTRTRLMLFGIREQFRRTGVDSVLFYEEFESARYKGRKYKDCEISWLLETNTLIINAAKRQNAEEYKRWRLYDISI